MKTSKKQRISAKGGFKRICLLTLLCFAPLGCGSDEPGEPLQVRASKCDVGGEPDAENKVSVLKEGSALNLDVTIRFNCVVDNLCAYELDQDNGALMDVLVAPCSPKRRDVAKCMCSINGKVFLPETQAKKVRVFWQGVYRPGETPERRLMAELDL